MLWTGADTAPASRNHDENSTSLAPVTLGASCKGSAPKAWHANLVHALGLLLWFFTRDRGQLGIWKVPLGEYASQGAALDASLYRSRSARLFRES